MGMDFQTHEGHCPNHLALRGKGESKLLVYSTLEGHNRNSFLSQLELLPGFPEEIPYAVLSA